MLEYSSNRYGKWRRVDIETVMLGDRLATDLNQWQLHAELKKMKLPRLTENMGKSEMIFLLGVHQQEMMEAKRAESTK
jgi:hypothetical protein